MSDTRTTMDDDRETRAADDAVNRRTDAGAMKWVSGLAALVGLWIAVSPFLFETVTDEAIWNNVVVGAAILLLAGYNFYRMNDGYPANVGAAAFAALLGLWSVAAPFVFEFVSETLVWSTVVSGALVALLTGYNAYRSRQTRVGAGTRAGA